MLHHNLSVYQVHSVNAVYVGTRTVFKGQLLCNAKGKFTSFYEGIITLGGAVKVLDVNNSEIWMCPEDLCFVDSYLRG